MLATATTCTDSESVPLAPSESSTFIFTLAVDGPSGKEHLKLPPDAVGAYEPTTSVPLFDTASQSGKPAEAAKVSLPGSLTVNEYVCVEPSSTEPAPESATVGATLAMVTDCVARLPAALSESVALAETTDVARPSGNVHLNEREVPVPASEPATFVPSAPHAVATDTTESWPGSEMS